MENIQLTESLMKLTLMETPVENYTVGILKMEEYLPTGEFGQYDLWSAVYSAGGFRTIEVLRNLCHELRFTLEDIQASEKPKLIAATELYELVISELEEMIKFYRVVA
jgi:hypothetical protein